MTNEELQSIRDRCEKATPGPWLAGTNYRGKHNVYASAAGEDVTPAFYDHVSMDRDDCEFIAHARTDIPAFLAEVERLRAEAKELQEEVEQLRELETYLRRGHTP